jgi:hypothetical protein
VFLYNRSWRVEAGRGKGVPVAELIRQVRISERTLYRLEETLQGAGNRPGPPVQTTAGREWASQAVGGGADVGQGDVAGRSQPAEDSP